MTRDPGKTLRAAREARHLRQTECAVKFGVDRSEWSRYESNDRTPRPLLAKAIAKYFKLDSRMLLGID
jgi:transcriptional regulator with XRE-family HTH domain